MRHFIMAVTLVLGMATGAWAQVPPVKNPVAVVFESPDHAAITGYEVDFVRVSDGVVIQTLTVAQAATVVLPNGDIRLTFNVQPIAFGSYTLVLRAVSGTEESDNSPASDPWSRSPGAPSKGTVQ